VQIAIDTELVEFEGWTMRIRPSQNPRRLMVLIHGYTGDENSMWVFARDLPPHYWMMAPRAPHPSGKAGYSWRLLQDSDPSTRPVGQSGQGFGKPTLDQLRSSAEALIRLVDAYQASVGIEADPFDVMGFSQGGVMSSVLAFLYPQRVRKIGILAGFVPSGLEAFVPARPLEGKSIFVAHGTKDETVAIERARSSIELLEQAGAQVTFCEDEVGHKVSAGCLQALKSFFRD
jgi:phospholipase/carboxylesterase